MDIILMFDVTKIQLALPPSDVTSGDATTNTTPSWVDASWDDDGPESMSALLETLKKHGEGEGFRALVDGVGASPLTALLEVGLDEEVDFAGPPPKDWAEAYTRLNLSTESPVGLLLSLPLTLFHLLGRRGLLRPTEPSSPPLVVHWLGASPTCEARLYPACAVLALCWALSAL